ncbi:MAG TPA: hypothetical protein VGF67_31460 [Ktedonobacteraceae bacterium]|jgi:cell division protein FtsL
MLVLGMIAADNAGDGSMRLLLLMLLMLAMLLLLVGAALALVALRHQQRDRANVGTLERVENEAG